MNFFGHATVACDRDTDPRYLLGAMLPDFVGMGGTRLAGTDDPQLTAGLALHHATDDVFHRAPTFVQQCKEAVRVLTGAGLPRGSARAVAHVGIELMLDGWLSGDPDTLAHYERALDVGLREPCWTALRWRDSGDGTRCRALIARVAHARLPLRYRDSTFVAERLELILASRPRLALAKAHSAAVQQWARALQPQIPALGACLLDEVRTGLTSVR